MGSFEEHIEFAKPTALVFACLAAAISISYTNDLVTSAFIGLGGYAAVLLGTSFPDVDHHASKPHRGLKRIVSVLAGGAVLYYLGPTLRIGSRDQSVLWLGALFGGVFLAVKGVPGLISVVKPVHRGITHTLSSGLLLSLLAAGVMWYFGNRMGVVHHDILGLIIFGGVFLGIYKHLELDNEL